MWYFQQALVADGFEQPSISIISLFAFWISRNVGHQRGVSDILGNVIVWDHE
jgi:hypothetical protein